MMDLKSLLLGVVVLATPMAALAHPHGPKTLTPQEMQATAIGAFGNGEHARALALAEALLLRDPNDPVALRVGAQAAVAIGQWDVAERHGRTLFRTSDDAVVRHFAARLIALSAANDERYTTSQFWLRRAAINAPDDRAYQQTQADYRRVRNLNPWNVNLGFSIAPSSNVNGGSETEFNIIDGLPFVGLLSGDAQALSGITATAEVRLTYAITREDDHATFANARLYNRNVWLSAEAQDTAPTSRNSDFTSQIMEISLDHKRQAGDGVVSVQALAGMNWFGGDIDLGYLRGKLGYSTNLNAQNRLSVIGEVEQSFDPNPWTRSSQLRTLTTALSHVTDDDNRITGLLSYDIQTSPNFNDRYETVTAQLSYAWSDPVGPLRLSVAAGASISQYPDYSIGFVSTPDGREDIRVFGNVTAILSEIEYAGFVPVVTLGVQDTRSNVSRFDRNEYSLNIGVRSSF